MSDPNDVLELSADLCRLSYGKLMHRKGRSAKTDQKVKRAGVLSFLSVLQNQELTPFFALLLREFIATPASTTSTH